MDSDFDTLSESSSSEYLDDIDSLYGGQARSIFSSLEETIEKIDDFLLPERKFMPGDIVSLLSDPLGQTGKVINVDITVDLENIYGSKIKNINSKNLHKIRSISVGDLVIQGTWIGKVEKIDDLLTVLFDDGTKCRLSAVGPEKITSISPDLIEDPQYPFYPGQRVRVESSSVSRSTYWLCGIGNDKHEQGTVCNVETGLVHVDWINSAVINGEKSDAPPCLQDARNLSLLSYFPHANWQLGDCCVFGVSETVNFQQIAVIVKTKTKVDVQWQNGNNSVGLDSHLLFPVNVVDVHDFWPGSYVLEKGTSDDSQDIQRWGVVRFVDSYERTVKVKWFKSEEEQIEEIVSAYELVEHPDYSFCLGEAVFRKENSVVDLSDDGSKRNHTENFYEKLLSHIGIVVGFEYGDVEVKWASGAMSKVAPHEIYRVDKCEDTATTIPGDENDQQSNEELQVKENQLLDQKTKDLSVLTCDNAEDSTSPSLSQFAVGFFTSITTSLFGSLCMSLVNVYKSTSEDGQILEEHPEEEKLSLCDLKLADLRIPEKITSDETKEADGDVMSPPGSSRTEYFKQFDMVSDCLDHHFVDRSMMSLQVKRDWLKKVHQEWSILEKDLPETIYVRVYEERMDLLRAAIVGSAGTPYHDGLFFFDIHLPPQYPNEPPMVYYNSGGLRINPNLYESGKVCLSLLNTWTGSGSEIWNPKSSTILQVLISLQALVLNERPYFNEAGYDTQIGKAEGEKNSISYNENAFLVNCRSMLYLLRRPPKHFEALVDEHFRRRWRDILMACKAYMDGAPIGYPFRCGINEGDNQKRSSTGFKIMLSKLIPRLAEAFSDKGIDCGNSLDQVP